MQVLDTPAALPAEVPDQGFPCRSCGTPLRYSMVDLGSSPPCQNVVRPDQLGEGETYYPLHAFVCHTCSLVQIDAVVPPEGQAIIISRMATSRICDDIEGQVVQGRHVRTKTDWNLY